MSNRRFVDAVRNLLGLHPLPRKRALTASAAATPPRVDEPCQACLARDGSSRPFNAAHPFYCNVSGFKREHDIVRDAIHIAVSEQIRDSDNGRLFATTEPKYDEVEGLVARSAHERMTTAAHYGRSVTPRPDKPVRGDILIRHVEDEAAVPSTHLFDLVFSGPPGRFVTAPSSELNSSKVTNDTYCDIAHRNKWIHYDIDLVPEQGASIRFHPLAFDRASGYISGKTQLSIDTIADIIDKFSRTSSSKHSVRQNLYDRVSVAIQNGIAARISVTRFDHYRAQQVAGAGGGAGGDAQVGAGAGGAVAAGAAR